MSLIVVERNDIIYQGLALISYGKMYGLAYVDKYMVVCHKNGKWELDKIIYHGFNESWLDENG